MSVDTAETLSALYEQDETAWLEVMSALALEGRSQDLDLPHLAEYLADMAKRDRREVKSRLTVMLAHLLKWEYQPKKRSRSWRLTVIKQRHELGDLAGQGVLRRHAESVLPDAYRKAVERAYTETGLPPGDFPPECPFTFDQLLTRELPVGEISPRGRTAPET